MYTYISTLHGPRVQVHTQLQISNVPTSFHVYIYIYLQIYIFRNMNTVRIAYILSTYSDLKHDCMYILFLQLFTCLHILSVIHLHTVILKFTYTYHHVFFRIYANILYIFASTNIHIHRHMCIYIYIYIFSYVQSSKFIQIYLHVYIYILYR